MWIYIESSPFIIFSKVVLKSLDLNLFSEKVRAFFKSKVYNLFLEINFSLIFYSIYGSKYGLS